MNMIHRPAGQFDTVDLLLADVALRIQLSPTQYKLATDRYNAINDWLERDGSPLAGLVTRFYPQGSMSIGATISSSVDNEDYDIDVMVELNIPPDTPSDVVLDVLYETVRGEPGSRYYKVTERRTRCVTVHYADMHIDLTPTVLVPERRPLTGWIFHHKPEDPQEPAGRYLANPWGFGKWYRENTPADQGFATAFARLAEGRSGYEMMAMAKADTEPVPEQVPITHKSMALVTHQLTKRWRNNRYEGHKGKRRPPSPLLACINAQSAGMTNTLAEELEYQVDCLLRRFEDAHALGRLIYVTNPECDEDEFTDRWPSDLDAQAEFIDGLLDFRFKVQRLREEDCDLAEMQAIMADLFGEHPTTAAFKAYNERLGNAVQTGRLTTGRDGRIDLGRSGLAGTGAAAATTSSASAYTAPTHKFFGGKWEPQ